MSTPRRPIIRYHGGKWMLAPWIIDHFPPHHTYVEPYGGGGSVLLRKERSYAEIYNDLDEEIVNVFTMARTRGDELRTLLELTPFSRTEFESSYETSDDPLEQARRTIARGFQGFGSAAASGEKTGFRASSSRSGTTPAQDWRNYPEAFVAIIDRLRGVVIECRDAMIIMAQHDSPRVLHFVDPPYVHSTRSTKVRHNATGKAYKHEMSDEQHQHLAVFLHGLKGMVVLSGYPSGLYDSLYEGWLRIDRAALADGARKRTESLWLNPAAERALPNRQGALAMGAAA